LAEDQPPQQVAAILGCSLASVYNWAATWQQHGQTGLREPKHAGRTRTLDAAALRLLEQWLETDPQTLGEQTTGWTVPLLHTRLTQAGSLISQRTLRRALHRLGWRWKRPTYVLSRPDPAYEEKRGRWSPASSRR
jgi:transposase